MTQKNFILFYERPLRQFQIKYKMRKFTQDYRLYKQEIAQRSYEIKTKQFPRQMNEKQNQYLLVVYESGKRVEFAVYDLITYRSYRCIYQKQQIDTFDQDLLYECLVLDVETESLSLDLNQLHKSAANIKI